VTPVFSKWISGDRGSFDSVAEGIQIVKTNPPDTKYPIIENCKELQLM
jgi:hypothetical protein